MGNAITSRVRIVLTLTALTLAVGAWGIGLVRWIGQANASQVMVIPVQDQVARASSNSVSRTKATATMSTGDELALAKGIDSDDAKVRLDALNQIRLLADSNPQALAIGLSEWVAPLIRAKQSKELAEITGPAILNRSFDPVTLQAAQRARVLAFLNDGDYSQALKEAKSYYNVASLSATTEAVDFIAQILQKTNSSAAAVEFKAQQLKADAGSTALAKIEIDPLPYCDAITGLREKAASKKGDTHNTLMALGNLLLLTDQVAEAKGCFEGACRSESSSGQNLRVAMEGVAKAIRAQDGNVSAADAFITSVRQNPSRAGITLAKPGFTAWEEMRISAQAITLSNLPTLTTPVLEQEREKEERNGNNGPPPTVVTGFEGSTPVYVAALSPTHLVVEITTSGFRDWFMFRVQGVANRTVRIDITGAYKSIPDWPQKAWSLNPVYSYAPSLDDPAVFATSQVMELTRASNGTMLPSAAGISWNYIPNTWSDNYTLSCVMHFDKDSAFIAMRVPRTPTYNSQFLDGLQSSPQIVVTQIGLSAKGRPLLVAQIGTLSPDKPCVLIYAGEHADEQDAGWVAQGAIEYLLADSPAAIELRQRYTFLVIPLLDPDASAAGIHESIISSFLPDRATTESITYANWFQSWINSGKRLDVAIDLHNIQSGEGPHVFCPLIEGVGKRGTLSLALHKRIVTDIQGAGYGVQLNPQMRGWMPDRLCGWLSHYYGTLSIAYEVNSQAPERHLSLAEVKTLGGVFVQSIGNFLDGTNRSSLLAEVDSRRNTRDQQWAAATVSIPQQNAIISEANVLRIASPAGEGKSLEKQIP